MTAARCTWCFCLLLLVLCCSLSGCAVRNQQRAGRDLSYSCEITISPSAELAGAKLPPVPGLPSFGGR